MISSQKEQAEVLRYGLEVGIRTVADAVAWADATIAADPQPDLAVIEVASSGQRRPGEVITLLRDVRGECDPICVIRRVMSDLRTALAAEPTNAPGIAKWLDRLATTGALPEEHFGSEAFSLDDAFELARKEHYGTFADAVHRLDAYLAQQQWREEV